MPLQRPVAGHDLLLQSAEDVWQVRQQLDERGVGLVPQRILRQDVRALPRQLFVLIWRSWRRRRPRCTLLRPAAHAAMHQRRSHRPGRLRRCTQRSCRARPTLDLLFWAPNWDEGPSLAWGPTSRILCQASLCSGSVYSAAGGRSSEAWVRTGSKPLNGVQQMPDPFGVSQNLIGCIGRTSGVLMERREAFLFESSS